MHKISAIAAMAACLLCAAAAPAFAQDAADDVQLKVSYADLNLATPAGVSALDQRISAAITRICGTADMSNVIDWKAMQRCRSNAQQSTQPARTAALASAKAQNDGQAVFVAAK